MLVEGLQAFLAADSGMQAELGLPNRSDKTSGIFPTLAPDSVPMPYVVMQQVSGDGQMSETMEGTGRLHSARWRFSCYGTTYKNAKKLAKALKLAMVSMLGELPEGDCQVEGSFWRLEADDAEPIPHGTIYETHVDFQINYRDDDVTP